MPSSKSWIARHKNGAFFSLVAIVLVAVVCTGVLAGVSYALRPAFADADARLDEAKGGEQRKLLFPDAKSFESKSVPSIEGLNSAYQADSCDWVFDVTSANGYHGDVELMVGITKDGKIAGIQTVASNETEGIGTKAISEDYFKTFKDLSASGELTVDDAASGQTHVDAVSGATFSSKAVVECVNIAISAYSQMGGN